MSIRASRPLRDRSASWVHGLLAFTLIAVAACTGSDGGQPAPDGSTPGSGVSTTASGDQQPSETSEDQQPSEPLADAYWQLPVTIDNAIADETVTALRSIDDEVWLIIRHLDESGVYRSRDAGVTWSRVDVAAPPTEGGVVLTDIVRGDSGRYLIAGTIESRCANDIDRGEHGRYISHCKDYRPLVFVSDDGDSWRRVEPPTMAPSGNTAVVIESIATDENGFLAAGTVRGADWHARLWSSPDGETWTLERELRDGTYPMSAVQVLSDGSDVVLLTAVHPCSDPWAGSPIGWYLGAGYRSDGRIFEGASAANVQLQNVGDHPLAAAPMEIDCAGSIFAGVPTPHVMGAHVGGAITLLQVPPPVLVDDEFVPAEDPYQVARLTDGTWIVAPVDQPEVDPEASEAELEGLLDIDGRVGLLFSQDVGHPLVQLTAVLPEGDDVWAPLEFGRPVVASGLGGQVWSGDSLLLVGTLRDDPYSGLASSEVTREVLAWRSIDGENWASQGCELSAGGNCQFTDLSRLDGYPDFAGLDLSGIDLSFSDLGEANFDGANLQGARIWDATGRAGSFVDADLTGAALQSTSMGDASGANFSDANLVRTGIRRADGATFDGAILDGARLEFRDRPSIPMAGWPGARVTWAYDEENSQPYELSLAGIDLTDMEIQGGFGDAPLLEITDLAGATLTGASFHRVDLSAIDPTIDLSEVDFWHDSVCPDGLPQDGDPRGTCVRTE